MATPAFENLTTPITTDEARTAILDILVAVGVPITIWGVGHVVRALVTVVAIGMASFSQLIAAIARSPHLDLATGPWLTALALYLFNTVRQESSFASGQVEVSNSSGSLYAGVAGDLIFINTSTNKTYRNTASFSITPGVASLVIPVEAIESGAASTALPGSITQLETPLTGVTVTNSTAVVGQDADTDEQLRALCRASIGLVSPNGPKDAYAYVSRRATRTDGSLLGITKVRHNVDGFGNVFVWAATLSGSVPGDVSDPSTDLGRLEEVLETQVVPLGATLQLASATPKAMAVTYSLGVYNDIGLTDAQLADAIETALVNFLRGPSNPIGGNILSTTGQIFLSDIISVIDSVSPDKIFSVDLSIPASDFTLNLSEIAVLGTVTQSSVIRVSPPQV